MTPGTVAHQALLSMEFSRKEYWNALSFPPPGDLPNPGMEPIFPALQASLLSEPLGKPVYTYMVCYSLSHVLLFATPWSVAHQAPLSVEVSRQEYWSGFPFPPPGDLLDRIEPVALMSPALAGGVVFFFFFFYH